MVRKFDRKLASQQQTPRDLNRKELETRFLEQVERYGLDDPDFPPELRNLFTLEEKVKGEKTKEQLHHIKPLRQFDGLFANTTLEQEKVLQQVLGSGDQIQNILSMPRIAHQGLGNVMDAIHTRMRNAGLEHGGKAGTLNPILEEIDLAADMPFEYKLHLADQYNKEIKPRINEILDDVLTEYEGITTSALEDAQAGTDAMANVLKDRAIQSVMSDPQMRRELKRVLAEDAAINIKDSDLQKMIAYSDTLKEARVDASPMTKSRMAGSPAVQDLMQEIAAQRDAQAAGAVVGEKPVVVNAGEGSKVYLRTNGNGHNGNGTAKHMFNNGK